MKYPEWVIPDEVDLINLRVQCETALVDYAAQSTGLFLCNYCQCRGFEELSLTLEATLGQDNTLTLETVIENLNNLPTTTARQDLRAHCGLRVLWLKMLKEKLNELS